MNTSPLRYPGGKSVITSLIEDIIKENALTRVVYAEPYAGGAGAALNLLADGIVDYIQINDACVAVFSFWKFLTSAPDDFMRMFENTDVNLDEWQKQRTIFQTKKMPSLELGFATFFLSRCNRSGILYAGPMGGQDFDGQKNAKYKIDCRFNKNTLRKQLLKVISLKERISVFNDDAIDFLKNIAKDNSLVYIDPPYYEKGKQLYMNFYEHKDHQKLAAFLTENNDMKWILSYDNVMPIQRLYSDFDLYAFNLNYSVQSHKKGIELFTHSPAIKMPKKPLIRNSKTSILLEKVL